MVYSGDGKDNATIPIKVTFAPIEATSTYPNGTTITVTSNYERINDTNTNWPALIIDNSTVYFTISQQIEASPSSSTQQLGGNGVPMEYGIEILVASILILITISIGVLVYLKRRQ